MGENMKQLKARVSHKHKTEAEWYLDVYTSAGGSTLREDPFIPLNGELIIFDTDSNHPKKRFKFGDGVTNVIALPFVASTEWDHVITTFEELKSLSNNTEYSGRILVADLEAGDGTANIRIPTTVTHIEFRTIKHIVQGENTPGFYLTLNGGGHCSISGLRVGEEDNLVSHVNCRIALYNFTKITDCRMIGSSDYLSCGIEIHESTDITDTDFVSIYNSKYIQNVQWKADEYGCINGCSFITNVINPSSMIRADITRSDHINGVFGAAYQGCTISECDNLSNIDVRRSDSTYTGSPYPTYTNCTNVDPYTCPGFSPSDVGKVRTITADGSYNAVTPVILDSSRRIGASGVQDVQSIQLNDYWGELEHYEIQMEPMNGVWVTSTMGSSYQAQLASTSLRFKNSSSSNQLVVSMGLGIEYTGPNDTEYGFNDDGLYFGGGTNNGGYSGLKIDRSKISRFVFDETEQLVKTYQYSFPNASGTLLPVSENRYSYGGEEEVRYSLDNIKDITLRAISDSPFSTYFTGTLTNLDLSFHDMESGDNYTSYQNGSIKYSRNWIDGELVSRKNVYVYFPEMSGTMLVTSSDGNLDASAQGVNSISLTTGSDHAHRLNLQSNEIRLNYDNANEIEDGSGDYVSISSVNGISMSGGHANNPDCSSTFSLDAMTFRDGSVSTSYNRTGVSYEVPSDDNPDQPIIYSLYFPQTSGTLLPAVEKTFISDVENEIISYELNNIHSIKLEDPLTEGEYRSTLNQYGLTVTSGFDYPEYLEYSYDSIRQVYQDLVNCTYSFPHLEDAQYATIIASQGSVLDLPACGVSKIRMPSTSDGDWFDEQNGVTITKNRIDLYSLNYGGTNPLSGGISITPQMIQLTGCDDSRPVEWWETKITVDGYLAIYSEMEFEPEGSDYTTYNYSTAYNATKIITKKEWYDNDTLQDKEVKEEFIFPSVGGTFVTVNNHIIDEHSEIGELYLSNYYEHLDDWEYQTTYYRATGMLVSDNYAGGGLTANLENGFSIGTGYDYAFKAVADKVSLYHEGSQTASAELTITGLKLLRETQDPNNLYGDTYLSQGKLVLVSPQYNYDYGSLENMYEYDGPCTYATYNQYYVGSGWEIGTYYRDGSIYISRYGDYSSDRYSDMNSVEMHLPFEDLQYVVGDDTTYTRPLTLATREWVQANVSGGSGLGQGWSIGTDGLLEYSEDGYSSNARLRIKGYTNYVSLVQNGGLFIDSDDPNNRSNTLYGNGYISFTHPDQGDGTQESGTLTFPHYDGEIFVQQGTSKWQLNASGMKAVNGDTTHWAFIHDAEKGRMYSPYWLAAPQATGDFERVPVIKRGTYGLTADEMYYYTISQGTGGGTLPQRTGSGALRGNCTDAILTALASESTSARDQCLINYSYLWEQDFLTASSTGGELPGGSGSVVFRGYNGSLLTNYDEDIDYYFSDANGGEYYGKLVVNIDMLNQATSGFLRSGENYFYVTDREMGFGYEEDGSAPVVALGCDYSAYIKVGYDYDSGYADYRFPYVPYYDSDNGETYNNGTYTLATTNMFSISPKRLATSGNKIKLKAGHKYYITSSGCQIKGVTGNTHADFTDTIKAGIVACGNAGDTVVGEYVGNPDYFRGFIISISGLSTTSRNIELSESYYIQNTNGAVAWVYVEGPEASSMVVE